MVFEDFDLNISDIYLSAQGKNSLNQTDGKGLRTKDPKSLISNYSVQQTKISVLN